MRKFTVFAMVAVFVIAGFASLASAAPNVTMPGKRGSLLVFPKIEVRAQLDPSDGRLLYETDTFITIGNDANRPVTLQCIWNWPVITEAGERRDKTYTQTCCDVENFTIDLTQEQVVYFSAGTGFANVLGSKIFETVNALPPAASGIGSLYCFAIESLSKKKPISHNRLYGEATIARFAEVEDNGISMMQYNAWPFWAYADVGKVMDSKDPNDPTKLMLTGKSGAYDACPDYLTFNFIARQSLPGSENLPFVGTQLNLVPCTQDLREFQYNDDDPINPTRTLAVFKIYNANEQSRSGTQACIKCYFEQILGVKSTERPEIPSLYNAFRYIKGDNFNYLVGLAAGGLGTLVGRAEVQGYAAKPNDPDPAGALCKDGKTVNTGLLGVKFDFIDVAGDYHHGHGGQADGGMRIINPDGIPEATGGSSLTGVGKEAATIRWSPEG